MIVKIQVIKPRKIKRLTLFNNSTTFEITGNELDQA